MIEHAELRALLPQRHPILLLDRASVVEPGRRVVGHKAITGSEPCYRDLPDSASPKSFGYPHCLLLESFGQAAAVLWLTSDSDGENEDGVLMFAGARDCRFVGRAYPGDTLHHEVRLEHVIGDNAFASGQTRVGDRVIATFGSLIAVRRPHSALAAPTPSQPRPAP
ncbi:3-hydroxyacyl-ACP dehydratase FabZ family protein [Salinactinospora qingdaonensis]|uniref:3-hydroxyacyl-[acyl-carrier-protein] dehydratase n=1 Tax=Salinactinospora qingdaonensis TaxID=702744 RepID=A0ABP7F9A8_9ACTN